MTYCQRSARRLTDLAAIARARGWEDAVEAGNGRRTPEGVDLRWQWVAPKLNGLGLAFPFFIDWLDSPHPAEMLNTRVYRVGRAASASTASQDDLGGARLADRVTDGRARCVSPRARDAAGHCGTVSDPLPQVAAAPAVRRWFGFPKGAWLIIGVEFWERFSFYGMLSILVLSLTAAPASGGFGWSASESLALMASTRLPRTHFLPLADISLTGSSGAAVRWPSERLSCWSGRCSSPFPYFCQTYWAGSTGLRCFGRPKVLACPWGDGSDRRPSKLPSRAADPRSTHTRASVGCNRDMRRRRWDSIARFSVSSSEMR
jgi:hypothetical protein